MPLSTSEIRQVLFETQTRFAPNLPMWVIYSRETKDFPGVYVVRLHLALPEPHVTTAYFTSSFLQDARDLLPRGLTRMPRFPQDDPTIIEVWL